LPSHDQPAGPSASDLDALPLPRGAYELLDDRCRRQSHRHRRIQGLRCESRASRPGSASANHVPRFLRRYCRRI